MPGQAYLQPFVCDNPTLFITARPIQYGFRQEAGQARTPLGCRHFLLKVTSWAS